jgi:hypothetical protein
MVIAKFTAVLEGEPFCGPQVGEMVGIAGPAGASERIGPR